MRFWFVLFTLLAPLWARFVQTVWRESNMVFTMLNREKKNMRRVAAGTLLAFAALLILGLTVVQSAGAHVGRSPAAQTTATTGAMLTTTADVTTTADTGATTTTDATVTTAEVTPTITSTGLPETGATGSMALPLLGLALLVLGLGAFLVLSRPERVRR